MEQRVHCFWQFCKGACNAHTCEYRNRLNQQNEVYDQQHMERSRRQGNVFQDTSTRGTIDESFGSPVHSLGVPPTVWYSRLPPGGHRQKKKFNGPQGPGCPRGTPGLRSTRPAQQLRPPSLLSTEKPRTVSVKTSKKFSHKIYINFHTTH